VDAAPGLECLVHSALPSSTLLPFGGVWSLVSKEVVVWLGGFVAKEGGLLCRSYAGV